MNIRNGLAAAIYRLLVAVLAMLGVWMYLDSFGWSAWRILATYVLMFTAVYFCVLALVGLITKNRKKRVIGSPMLEGALTIALLIVSITTFVFMAGGWVHPALSGGAAALSYVTLPVLVIADWLIFMPKGRWQSIYPFYWLAFPTIYVAAILLSAELCPEIDLRYPLAFLDYRVYDIVQMIWVLIFYAVCILTVGYGFYGIDALVGGKVGKYIVLPKIKLVEVDEDTDREIEMAAKSQNKLDRLVPRNSVTESAARLEKRRSKAPKSVKVDKN